MRGSVSNLLHERVAKVLDSFASSWVRLWRWLLRSELEIQHQEIVFGCSAAGSSVRR